MNLPCVIAALIAFSVYAHSQSTIEVDGSPGVLGEGLPPGATSSTTNDATSTTTTANATSTATDDASATTGDTTSTSNVTSTTSTSDATSTATDDASVTTSSGKGEGGGDGDDSGGGGSSYHGQKPTFSNASIYGTDLIPSGSSPGSWISTYYIRDGNPDCCTTHVTEMQLPHKLHTCRGQRGRQ